ncbi:hypothetical protein [Vibrio phage pTD1]|uniref:Uncharacterized protein n=1 Tax=Vibrio phage pTD1 TaxID=1938577 RepID=A0A1Q2U302_9CAUD|nr:hypothetical protein FDH33_gp151 [Vibrio phage pTD1]BAW98360.1 hypothetical protein [Vibrio phage pTD1]
MTPLEAKQYAGTVLLHDLATQLPEVLKIYQRRVIKERLVTLVKIHLMNKHFIICLENKETGIRVMIKNADALSVSHPDIYNEVWEIVDPNERLEVEELMTTLYRSFDKLFDEQLTLEKLQNYRKHMVDNVSIRQHPIRPNFLSDFLGNKIMGEYELLPNRKVSFIVKDGFFLSKPTAVFRFEDTGITGHVQVTEMTRGEVYRYVSKDTND